MGIYRPASLYLPIIICLTTCSASFAQQLFEFKKFGTTMGNVSYSVKAYLPDQPTKANAGAIESSLSKVDSMMSTYKPDSDVSRFNASRQLDWFSVSDETAVVVARALEISRATDGAFDITVGPLVNLWNFGPNKGKFVIPSADDIEQARARVGYEKLSVRLSPPALKKNHEKLEIDLSAIAKGYAVDLMAGVLMHHKAESYLIELGGEVRAFGSKPDESPWVVGIEKPADGIRAVYRRIELGNRAMASSGDYRQFHVIDGQRYSHTINPHTGRPVEHDVAAVSVVADDCMTADAVATALMVNPNANAIAPLFGAEAMVIRRTDEEHFSAATTAGFPVGIKAPPAENQFVRTLIAATIVFLVVAVAMSVGVIISGRRMRGSCGGIAALDNPDVTADCSVCSAPSNECRQLKKELKRRDKMSES